MTATETRRDAPAGEEQRRSWRRRFGAAGYSVIGMVRTIPFTFVVFLVYWIGGAATGSFVLGPDSSLAPQVTVQLEGLVQGRWWTVFTSPLFDINPGAYVLGGFLILVAVGLAESVLGTIRTLLIFFGGQLATVTLFLLCAQVAAYGGDGWLGGMVDAPLIGPYAAATCSAMAASASLGRLWRRRVRALVFAITVMLVLYIGHPDTVAGFLGALVGLVIGWLGKGGTADLHLHRSTTREVRNILAMVVAIFAAGPLLTAFATSPSGPLAIMRDIVINPIPTLSQLQANCGGTVDVACLQQSSPGGFGGPATVALAIVPVFLQLVCAEGLRRGRALALWLTLAVQLAVTGLTTIYLSLFARIPHYPSRPHTAMLGSAVTHLLPAALVPLAIAVVLFLNRRRFTTSTPRSVRRGFLLVVAGSFFVLVGSYVVAWFAGGGPGRRGGLAGLVAELARQYLPLPIPPLYGAVFDRRSPLESFLFANSGTVFWLIVLVCVLFVFLSRSRRRAGNTSADVARRLVLSGGDSLSWMATWEHNQYWFNPAGTAGIAFQEHGHIALTVGGPFGVPSEREAAAEGFLLHCAEHGLSPCFYSVADELWPMLRRRGFSRVPVAQETRLHVRELEFKGSQWQNVRTALNKARRLGIEPVWGRWHTLAPHLRSQLKEVSEEWASEKPMPEMGFTLGGLDELMDDAVLICLAVDGEGQVHGVTSWLPVYRDGVVVSWTLDFMRRRSDGFGGVMEFLIASAVLHLRDSVDTISLSGSPLAAEPDGEGADLQRQDAALARLLNMVGSALEPVYGFRSLATFKSRFKPEYRSLYMIYEDPLKLPAIGRALSQAYLPDLSVRHTARLLRSLVS